MFTLEVAIQTMAKNVEQFVLLFDASKFLFAKFKEILYLKLLLLLINLAKLRKNDFASI